jgi:hemolysin activation/secretion protein
MVARQAYAAAAALATCSAIRSEEMNRGRGPTRGLGSFLLVPAIASGSNTSSPCPVACDNSPMRRSWMKHGDMTQRRHRAWHLCAAATVLLWGAENAVALAQTENTVPGFSSQNRGGGPPILPEIAPLPPPAAVPPRPAPAPPAAAAKPGLRTMAHFILRGVHIVGNTVLDDASIHAVLASYLDKSVTLDDLEEIRQRFTQLYIDRGYVNSGAVIPDQDVANGVVTFRFIEGRVTDIEIAGTDHFRPEYFRSRLQRAAAAPFNINNLAEEQQILLQDPLIRRLNIELVPGPAPGEARLDADVDEARRFSLSTEVADDQSPTVGEIRGQVQGTMANLLDSSLPNHGEKESENRARGGQAARRSTTC